MATAGRSGATGGVASPFAGAGGTSSGIEKSACACGVVGAKGEDGLWLGVAVWLAAAWRRRTATPDVG
jgi:hypothetical protein